MSAITVDASQLVAFAAEIGAAAAAVTPAAENATEESAERIQDMAEARAPRLTGELAAGFEVEGSGLSRTVINRTRQAFFQEHGTSRHAPQPSLYPSADAVEPDYVEAIGEAGVKGFQ